MYLSASNCHWHRRRPCAVTQCPAACNRAVLRVNAVLPSISHCVSPAECTYTSISIHSNCPRLSSNSHAESWSFRLEMQAAKPWPDMISWDFASLKVVSGYGLLQASCTTDSGKFAKPSSLGLCNFMMLRGVSLVLELPSGAWEYIQEWKYFTKGINMPNNSSNWVYHHPDSALSFPKKFPQKPWPKPMAYGFHTSQAITRAQLSSA